MTHGPWRALRRDEVNGKNTPNISVSLLQRSGTTTKSPQCHWAGCVPPRSKFFFHHLAVAGMFWGNEASLALTGVATRHSDKIPRRRTRKFCHTKRHTRGPPLRGLLEFDPSCAAAPFTFSFNFYAREQHTSSWPNSASRRSIVESRAAFPPRLVFCHCEGQREKKKGKKKSHRRSLRRSTRP